MKIRTAGLTWLARQVRAAASISSERAMHGTVWFLLCLACSSLPLSFRLLHMWERGYQLHRFDISGILCDLAIGMTATVVLVAAFARSLWLFVVLAAAWIFLNGAYYEFLREYGSPFFVYHAGQMLDPSFVAGSGMHVTHPVFLAAMTALLLAGTVWLARHRSRDGFRLVAAGTLLFLAVVELTPKHWNMTVWRQRDFVSANVIDLATRLLAIREEVSPAMSSEPAFVETFRANLEGEPIVPLDLARRPNVLLVLIEGVAGGHLPLIANRHGNDGEIKMLGLDTIAHRGLAYSTYISHQKQSNRGIYSMLCGDFDRLAAAVAKMTEIANGMKRRCLPEILRRNGYGTVFLEAGDIEYMLMDQFMPKAGFDISLGADSFDASVPRNTWGIFDAGLYERALVEIERLEQKDRPWFVTLYTATTHHPYELPPDYVEDTGLSPRIRAWHYADRAITRFMAEMERRGRLEDTLILISSDEASPALEIVDSKVEMLNGMTENWGLMLALGPGMEAQVIDEPFQQADFALSILDYLGLADEEHDFIGRSMFRIYPKPRPLYFANIYKGRVYEVSPAGMLTICDESLSNCRAFDTSGSTLFGHGVEAIAERATAGAVLRAVQSQTLRSVSPVFELALERPMPDD